MGFVIIIKDTVFHDTPQTHPDTPQTTPRQRKRILNFNRIICCNLILKFLTDSLGLAQLSPSLFFLKSQWDFPTLTWMNNDHTKVQQARFLKKYKILSCQLNHLVFEISRLPIRLLKKRTGSKCQGQKIHCFFFKLQNMTGVPKSWSSTMSGTGLIVPGGWVVVV